MVEMMNCWCEPFSFYGWSAVVTGGGRGRVSWLEGQFSACISTLEAADLRLRGLEQMYITFHASYILYIWGIKLGKKYNKR